MEIIRTKSGRLLEVAEEHPGCVRACNVGGGFLLRVPLDDIAERDVEIPMNDHQLMTVGFDDEPFGRAWVHRTFRWNGWVEPLVTAGELQTFVDAQERLNRKWYESESSSPGDWDANGVPVDGMTFAWEGGESPLIVTYGSNVAEPGEERMEIQPHQIELDLGAEEEVDLVLVWSLGLGLTWSEVPVPADRGIVPGARVRFRTSVERYPHFIVPEGALGTVSSVESRTLFWVTLDEELDGAEEWKNAVNFDMTQDWVEDDPARGVGHFVGESLDDVMEQIEVISGEGGR